MVRIVDIMQLYENKTLEQNRTFLDGYKIKIKFLQLNNVEMRVVF